MNLKNSNRIFIRNSWFEIYALMDNHFFFSPDCSINLNSSIVKNIFLDKNSTNCSMIRIVQMFFQFELSMMYFYIYISFCVVFHIHIYLHNLKK